MATILVVDDCDENRQRFAAAVHHLGHRLLEAVDCWRAIELARNERPQLIVAGPRATERDGFNLVGELRSDCELAETPIILFADRDDQLESVDLDRAVDGTPVVPMPGDPNEIVRVIGLTLKGSGNSGPSSAGRRRTAEAERVESVTRENARLNALRCRHLTRLKRYRSILAETQQLAHVGNWNWDIQTDTLTWSDEQYRIFGLEPQASAMTFDRAIETIHPDDRETALKLVDRALREHQSYEYCLRVLHKDGTVRHIRSRGQAVFDESGRPERLFGTVHDITDRMRADNVCRETEQRLCQLAERMGEVFWMKDYQHSQVIYVSPAYEKIWGRTRESLYAAPQSWSEAIHSADRERVNQHAARSHAHETNEETYRIVRPDGSIRWIREQGFPVHDAEGELIRMAGIAADITDLKRAEKERRHYAQHLEAMNQIDRAILEARSPREICQVVVSRARRLLPCQRASVLTFDFSAGQGSILAVGGTGQESVPVGARFALDAFGNIDDLHRGRARNLDDLLTVPDRPAALEAAAREGIRSQLLVPIKSRSELLGLFSIGHSQPAIFGWEEVKLAREIADRVAVALHDSRMSEQAHKAQEKTRALTVQLIGAQEGERRRISRELHDEIGQSLAVTKLRLQALKQMTDNLVAATQSTMASVESTVQQVRQLSYDIRPPMLDDLGLAAALRFYLDRQAQSGGFPIEFEMDHTAGELTPEIETACFRIVQEAIANIVRHARPQHVRVELTSCKADLQLRIHDDGVGFDVAMARRRAVFGVSLGLLVMEERATLLGGQIIIESAPHRGTEVRVCFPLQFAS